MEKITLQVKRLTEGVPFEVNPLEINRELFLKKRNDYRQEETRQYIWEAFNKVDAYPGKYDKPFYTLHPEKTWKWKTVWELKELATEKGDHIADWVEQALEWAQRIQNGETWETICNESDTSNWHRLIWWMDGHPRIVGGSRVFDSNFPASYVLCDYCYSNTELCSIVPLVVLYKQHCTLLSNT